MEMDGDGIPRMCAGTCMQVGKFEEFIKMEVNGNSFGIKWYVGFLCVSVVTVAEFREFRVNIDCLAEVS